MGSPKFVVNCETFLLLQKFLNMGVNQSKGSVDITSTPNKGPAPEVNGKKADEKIIDEKTKVNGDANGDAKKKKSSRRSQKKKLRPKSPPRLKKPKKLTRPLTRPKNPLLQKKRRPPPKIRSKSACPSVPSIS